MKFRPVGVALIMLTVRQTDMTNLVAAFRTRKRLRMTLHDEKEGEETTTGFN